MSAQKQDPKKRRPVDLNKMRAARLEALGDGPRVKFGATTFQCPPEIPFAVIDHFGQMEQAEKVNDGYASSAAMKAAVQSLLNGQFDAFMAESPSTADMVDFITAVFEEYGVAEGESEASPAS